MEKSQFSHTINKNTCIDSYNNIRTGARLDRTYITMNTLATIIACYGLLENSPAVIIGAMVVATLLGPIIGIALGVVEADNKTLRNAVVSEVVGICIVFLTAFIIGFIHRDLQITNELLTRTAPNFIDLMIGLAGGAAGAYAMLFPSMGLSLVGVAIAIALVPPISASAILLARGDFSLAGGATLLAFTNIVAIEFSASLVLFIFKCTRVSFNIKSLVKAVPRYSITIIILLALGVVLIRNLDQVIVEQTFKTQTYGIVQKQIMAFSGTFLESISYDTTTSKTEIVRAVVRGPYELTPAQVATVAVGLPVPPKGRSMDFRVRFVQTAVITPNGYLYNDTASR